MNRIVSDIQAFQRFRPAYWLYISGVNCLEPTHIFGTAPPRARLCRAGSIVWIDQGEEEGLGGVLSSTREQGINIALEVVPGPSRPITDAQSSSA